MYLVELKRHDLSDRAAFCYSHTRAGKKRNSKDQRRFCTGSVKIYLYLPTPE